MKPSRHARRRPLEKRRLGASLRRETAKRAERCQCPDWSSTISVAALVLDAATQANLELVRRWTAASEVRFFSQRLT